MASKQDSLNIHFAAGNKVYSHRSRLQSGQVQEELGSILEGDEVVV